MARPVSFLSVGFRDYSNEPSNITLPVTTQNVGNLTAQLALLTSLETAILGITLGNIVKSDRIFERLVNLNTPPMDVNAQREKKWLIRYHDATTFLKYQSEAPCADLTLLAPASDFMSQTATPYTDLKTAWEAVVRSPDDNNLTVLDSIQFVGRRL